MKPVLIQHLHKKNKGKYKATPTTQEEKDQYNDTAAKFVLWFLAVLVVGGIMLS